MLLLGTALASTTAYRSPSELARDADCAVSAVVVSVEEDGEFVYRLGLKLDAGYSCEGLEQGYVLVNRSLSSGTAHLSGKRVAGFVSRSTSGAFFVFAGNGWYVRTVFGDTSTHQGRPVVLWSCEGPDADAPVQPVKPWSWWGWLRGEVDEALSFEDFLVAFDTCRSR
jgi:hypothetical protein